MIVVTPLLLLTLNTIYTTFAKPIQPQAGSFNHKRVLAMLGQHSQQLAWPHHRAPVEHDFRVVQRPEQGPPFPFLDHGFGDKLHVRRHSWKVLRLFIVRHYGCCSSVENIAREDHSVALFCFSLLLSNVEPILVLLQLLRKLSQLLEHSIAILALDQHYQVCDILTGLEVFTGGYKQRLVLGVVTVVNSDCTQQRY